MIECGLKALTDEQLLEELEQSSQHIESANYETCEQQGVFDRYDAARAETLRRLSLTAEQLAEARAPLKAPVNEINAEKR